MNMAYLKDILREIKKSPGRFISLVIITALGTASIAGIQATSVSMRGSADSYYKAHSLYDLQLKSTAGFDEDDISALRGIPGAAVVMPAYIYDVFVYSENESRAVRTYSLPKELNKIEISEGRLPESSGEAAVERRLLRQGGYNIGDTIHLGLDGAVDFMLGANEAKIVGVIDSPLYINLHERGSTSLGDGRLNFYLYLHEDAYNLEVYTDIYIQMEGSRETGNLTDEYYELLEEWKELIKETGNKRIQQKTDELAGLSAAYHGLISYIEPEWFYFTRKDGISFDSYYQDTLRIEQIGYVFPLVFFLVAVLVSLTTMSRMVEEHRTQIGIYKALGYTPAKSIIKYIFYAAAASISGGLFGVAAGIGIFPRVIFDAYAHLYKMPPLVISVPLNISAAAVISAAGAVLAVTFFTCSDAFFGAPAELMRPKSPPAGKRVVIEKIGFVWNRLGFINKVTARNIFRYKKRFIMTLIGVAGCSALLVTAFGLRDSIGGVDVMQFERVVTYSSRTYLREITEPAARERLDSLITGGSHLFIREEVITAQNNNKNLTASLIIPEFPEELFNFINLRARKTGAAVSFGNGGVVLTEKLAREIGVGINDSFDIRLSGGRVYKAAVSGIVENYVLHYIYMPPGIYIELFGAEPVFNGILSKNTPEYEAEVTERLLSDSGVRAVVNTEDVKRNLGESTDALQVVTVVLIILACALAFVVLFNLTNINITERIRELATIKVLGFYDSELAMYIYRENGLVAAMGICAGLIGGVRLHGFILNAAEIDMLMFPQIIKPESFIYSALLSCGFAVFVNLVMNFKLVRIDMVESLKNIE
ncbi:MAG: ABC transporter permease [Oscillospiraceae bacterium]|nr:ABC transporter permease [Oscillospiraceae bacterium]